MTNDNLAAISAIKSFKLEKDIYKQVLKTLIDKEADDNLIAILLNPDLTDKIIDENKYTEALDYVLHTYQQERILIVHDMRVKAYERHVQAALEEAKVSSVPTRESIDLNSGIEEVGMKPARDAAQVFIDGETKKPEEPTVPEEMTVPLANDTVKKGAEEIVGSLEETDKVKEAAEEMEEAEELEPVVPVPAPAKETPKAEVDVPSVHVLPGREEEKKVEHTTEEKTETPVITKPKEELDEEEHEVVAQKKSTSFFQRHKKAILIASGLATIAITSAVFPTLIIPSIMNANSILWNFAPFTGIKTVLHGLNTVLGKIIGATFSNGIWKTAGGAVINGAAANTCLATAVATYGLWGIYGKGFVGTIKRMFGAVDLENEQDKEEEKEAEAELQEEEIKDLKPEPEKKETPTLVEEPKEEVVEEVKPIVEETDTPEETETESEEEEKSFDEYGDDDFRRAIEDLMAQKRAKEREEQQAKGMKK